MTSPVLVYLRDASWYDRPDTRWPKRYHRASSVPGHECMAACSPNRIMLDDDSATLSTRIPFRLICLRCFDVNVSPRNDVNVSLPDDVPPCG